MNKKLLLSFAVFATALSVNAQKRGYIKDVPHRVSNTNIINYNENIIETKNTSQDVQFISRNKRGAQNFVDTSTYFSTRRSYASPKTGQTALYSYPSVKGDSTEMSTAYQIVPNTSKITVKGIRMSMVSLNKIAKKANVDIKVYSFKDGSTLAKSTKEIAYSATSLAVYDFIFDKPLVTDTSFLVSIEPSTESDSVLFLNSGAYRNASITCDITGDQLTLPSAALTTNLGTGFWFGQEISGAGIAPGTKIVGSKLVSAATSTSPAVYSYTISKAVTAPLTNVVVTGVNLTFDDQKYTSGMMYFKYPNVAGSKTKPDFTKPAKETPNGLIYINTGTTAAPVWKYYESNITMFPIVEYTFESTPDIDNKCLGDKNQVNISYKNVNPFSTAKNPLLNKMAFWTKYLGYNKKSGYFYSRVISSSNSAFRDSIDNNTDVLKYNKNFTYSATDKNDTIRVYDFILPYGYFVSPGTKGLVSTFLISSKVTPAASITPDNTKVTCFLYDAKSVLPGIGGFAPFTGLPKVGDVAAKYSVVDVNGCKGEITTLAPVAVANTNVKEIVVKSELTEAKCFGDKSIVKITATGGKAPLVLPAVDTLVAKATTKTYFVTDADKCQGKLDVVIKNAPDTLSIKTVSTQASNNKKNDGAIASTVTGGTSPYKYAWENATTKVASTQTTATLTETVGSYKLTVTDANGCTKVTTAAIGDKKLAIEELGLTNVSVYPNPVKETLNVSFDAKSIATVELVNLSGQVLDVKKDSDVTFNTSGLVSGIYFVNIKVAEGVYTHKIIKE